MKIVSKVYRAEVFGYDFNAYTTTTILLSLFIGLGISFIPPIYMGAAFFALFFCAFFIFYTKIFIYFFIFLYPLLGLLYSLTSFGSDSAALNIGGLFNIGIIFVSLLLFVVGRIKIGGNQIMVLPMIVFLSVIGCSILLSPEKLLSTREWIRYVMPAMFYFLVVNFLKDDSDIDALLKLMLYVSVIIPVAFGIYQFAMGDSSFVVPYMGKSRIYGTLGHPNSLAMFLLIMSLLAMHLTIVAESKIRYINFGLIVIFFMLLFKTYARIGWFSFVAAASVWALLRSRKSFLLVALFSIIVLLAIPGLTEQIVARVQPEGSLLGRYKLNDLSLHLISQKPLLGYGIGTYGLYSQTLSVSAGEQYGIKTGLVPHNDYLRFMFSAGIIGLLAYIFLFIGASRLSLLLIRQSDERCKKYGSFLISFICGVLVFAVSDQSFELAGFYFWIFVAAGQIILRNRIAVQA